MSLQESQDTVASELSESRFLADVLQGLSSSPKTIPSSYLYDLRGCELFDAICELPEYYPTRTEAQILRQYQDEIASNLPDNFVLVEIGSGSSVKTRILLDRFAVKADALRSYIPMDIAEDHLLSTVAELRQDYAFPILPIAADFRESFELPADENVMHPKVLFFPGSTIGNFTPKVAVELLERLREICGDDGQLIIGIDRLKDVELLKPAYNDAQGVTAAFNLNLLQRINRELNADFDLDQFEHEAVFNEQKFRMEMHLRSLSAQTVRIDGVDISFEEGESICTEYSHKYPNGRFEEIAEQAGFHLQRHWRDDHKMFNVFLFRA